MSGKNDKKTRREVKHAVRSASAKLFAEIKQQINAYPFRVRLQFAWRILQGKF